MISIKLTDLRDAFEFANAGFLTETNAYVCSETGAIYYVSSEFEPEEEVPDDLETSDRYIAVPKRSDLDLGRHLALSFVDQELPDDYALAADFFRKKGAYRRFKGFLDSRGMLEKWYAFEENATETALRQWCADNNVRLGNEQPEQP